jgi:hypothetical protein
VTAEGALGKRDVAEVTYDSFAILALPGLAAANPAAHEAGLSDVLARASPRPRSRR